MERGLKDRMEDGGEKRKGRPRGPTGQFLPAEKDKRPVATGCPRCGRTNYYVVRTKPHHGGWKRRRACRDCGAQWDTIELPVEDAKEDTTPK